MSPDTLLRWSGRLKVFIETVGKAGSVFILPLVFVTMWDVMARKLGGIQFWLRENVSELFGSTLVQELEWHFHTALFVLVLGYAYVNNRHVRVDLVREKLGFRSQAWIEFLGCTFFLIPYCAVVLYFAAAFAWDSFVLGEISASTVGLAHRWIIKSCLVVGLFLAFLSGIAVWLQTLLILFGPRDLRFELMTLEWPEEQARKARVRAGSAS